MSDMGDRVVPDLEARMEEAVQTFRANHRHPANLALHAVGYLLAADAAVSVLRGRVLRGIVRGGLAVGLLVAGHRIEGTEPFTAVRRLVSSNGRGT